MTNKNGQQPMILLISKQEREESFFKQWLEENEPNVCEASDILQVIEEINDFTARQCSDVFLLDAESASEDSLEELFYFSSVSSEIQIVAYSKTFGGNQNSAFPLAA